MQQNSKFKYLNKRFQNSDKEWFTVIEYINGHNITIQFDDETKLFNQQSSHINRGLIKNPNPNKLSNSLIPTLYDIGYLGIGKYNSKNNIYYNLWLSMFQRCYDKNTRLKYPSYIDCLIDPIWHNFQNFALWCEENYIEKFQIDKDILFKGNKIYSPETCCFVPQEINNLFEKCNKSRGKYPIGINLKNKKFQVQVRINGIQKYLGVFNTIEEAFQVYKITKEKHIKEIADKWKQQISEKVYQAMYNYQVKIID